MQRLIIAAIAAAILAGAASAQTSSLVPRFSGPDPQDDISRMLAQRQRQVEREQQQSFDGVQRQLEAERRNSLPVLPTDPLYRGSLLGQ
jgi:microcompartment protein CcmL/EutN